MALEADMAVTPSPLPAAKPPTRHTPTPGEKVYGKQV